MTEATRRACAGRLKNQVALITGASSGIGKGIALAMADEGAHIVVNYNSHPESAREVVGEVAAKGVRAIAIQADVSKEDQVQSMFREAVREFGTIDILVNNSGIQRDAPFDEMSLEYWREVIDVNLTGAFLCSREAVREFKRREVAGERSLTAGKIIFISSVHEVIPWATHCNYAASKGGMLMLMKSLAQEVAPDRIKVNSIAPGAIKTSINRESWETPEAEQRLLRLIPWNRVGETRDVGSIAVWLASDESDYVQGTTIYVDGGMTLYPGFSAGG
ncbi:MAG: SDR family oxidoreductase [Candidatus Latescibacterota bacterium]